MKREMISWFFLLLGLCTTAFGNQDALQAVKQGNNLLSSQLYDVIRKKTNESLVLSPVSISTAFAMLQAGAREETATAIRSAFHFPADEQLNPGYQSLIHQLQSNSNITMEMVNRIYPAEMYSLNPKFRETLKTYFGAEPQQLNFEHNVEAARVINSFVNQSTHGKIEELVTSDDLDINTKLVLINAVYFKGNWKHPFPKHHTTKMEFYTSETASAKVNMMRLETTLLYGEIPELDAKAVSLPYEGDRWSMVVLLPNQRTGIHKMEEKLKFVRLDDILNKMWMQKIELYLPKFKLESSFDLEESIKAVGAGVIFDQFKANLTGIPERPTANLYLGKVVHKAFIEVNEEGSEASAATGVKVPQIVSLPSPEPVVLVDHPFYSMIVHREVNTTNSGQTTPIFIQRITNIKSAQ